MEALEVDGATAMKEAGLASQLRTTTVALKEAKAILAQQHKLLQQAVLASPAKASSTSPLRDAEDDWVLRQREQELDQRESRLQAERDEVLERSLELQQERDQLNVSVVAAWQVQRGGQVRVTLPSDFDLLPIADEVAGVPRSPRQLCCLVP